MATSGCAVAATGYEAASKGLEAYCKLPPAARAQVRAKAGLDRQLIRCPGDPAPVETPTATAAGLRGLI